MLLKRLWKQIAYKRKKQLLIIIVIMLLSSFAEVLSIGAVIPFLGVLANPELIFQHDRAQFFVNYFGLTEANQLLFPFTVIFITAVLLAGLTRIILLWGQTRLAHAIGTDFSYQIYKNTLYQSYSDHISQNSSDVVATIATKVDQVVSEAILSVINILSSLVMLSMILTLLIVIHPVMAITAMIGFVLIYSALIKTTKNKLHSNSNKISKNTSRLVKFLNEGLGGIRDILIDSSQESHLRAFRSVDVSRRRALANNQIIGQSPRYAVEALGMVLIACLAFSLSENETRLIGALPMIGALAVGAQRMLPMAQLIYGSLSSIRGGEGTLRDSLVLLEKSLPDNSNLLADETVLFHKLIQLNELSFRYQKNAPLVLSKINLKIPKGSMIGFIGTTGSGKSTLLDITMGLLQPSEGELKIDGVEINAKNCSGWQSHIAHIPQTIYLSDSTIAENIAFGLPKEQIDYKRVISVAKKAQIDDTIQSWEGKYNSIVGERGVRLSGGQRQRIGIARALYKNASVLIFDEATSALDNKTEKAVMTAINAISKDVTILLVAHRLSTLTNCDFIIELENGKIIS